MLFDERPKARREDLFDRVKEVSEVIDAIDKGRPIIVLSGIRRIGKTSVLLVALNEVNVDSVLIDCRALKENYGRRELYALFSTAFSSKLDKLRDVLKGIRGVSIMGNYVELKWSGRDYLSLTELFDKLNRRRLVIALDEAQRLRGPLANEVKDAIAHAYDYDRNLTFILTGSEVGLLHELLNVDDEESPLYGRYYHEVTLGRFSVDESEEFLRRGFSELSISVGDDVITSIAEYFDGIPGWLTLAGNVYARTRDLSQVRETAIKIAMSEIENLIRVKERTSPIVARRYETVLKCIANGSNSWSRVLRCLEDEEGSTISSSVLHNIITNLEKLSIIKDYEFLDPIYREASKRLKG